MPATRCHTQLRRRDALGNIIAALDTDGKWRLVGEDIILPRIRKREAPDGVVRQGVRRRRDALGNIIAMLDNTGAVVVKYKYDAWGNTIVTNVSDDAISDDLGHNKGGPI